MNNRRKMKYNRRGRVREIITEAFLGARVLPESRSEEEMLLNKESVQVNNLFLDEYGRDSTVHSFYQPLFSHIISERESGTSSIKFQ